MCLDNTDKRFLGKLRALCNSYEWPEGKVLPWEIPTKEGYKDVLYNLPDNIILGYN